MRDCVVLPEGVSPQTPVILVIIDENGRRRSNGFTHHYRLLGTDLATREVLVVTAQLPDDRHDPFSGSRPTTTGEIGLWTAVLEFAPGNTGRPVLLQELQALMEALDEWNPSGLWHPDRYAIQLQIPARYPHQALAWALGYHRDAARSGGLPSMTPLRVEVLTLEEFERSLQQFDPACPGNAEPSRDSLLSDELFYATRSLHGATTARELTDIVGQFVTSIGGRIEPGTPRHLADTIDVDVSMECDKTLRATADALSVTGLIVEQLLPVLVADARVALARLPKNLLTDIPPNPSNAADR